MVVAKAVMEKELVKPAAVEKLVGGCRLYGDCEGGAGGGAEETRDGAGRCGGRCGAGRRRGGCC